MNTAFKVALGVAGVYVVGGLGTLAYLASEGDARLAAGKPVYKGGVVSAFLAWPYALLSSVGD